MIRFEVNGEYLDLPADFSLQFKKKNILFSFDNIECERSTSFDIPATPHNNAIFTLAKWVQSEGVGMRRKYQAQMQDGLVVQDGFLHIDQYSAGKYNAVFVTGDLLGLKKIRDAGKIKDFWHPMGSIVVSEANIKDANTYAGQLSFAITRYVSNVALLHPSFNLGDVIQYAYNNLTGKNLPAYSRECRLIPKELKGIEKTELEFVFGGSGASPTPAASFPATQDANAITCSDTLIMTSGTQQLIFFDLNQNAFYWRLRQFIPKQEITINFPNNFPSNYFIMSIRDTGNNDDPQYYDLADTWFLGGYSFKNNTITQQIEISGEPLAGKSAKVSSGQPFIFMDINWYVRNLGFTTVSHILHTYDYTLQAEGGTIQEGDTVRAYDLLPDLTLTDLLKMYVALEGKMLYYDENGDIQFDDLDVSTWGTFDLTGKVIDESAMSRKFGDYAQQNIIDFKSGSDVMPSHRVSAAYTIDNDNIDEEKTLLTIPYSEGEIEEQSGFIVARFDAEDMEKNTLYEQGIMYARGNTQTGSIYGERVILPKNTGLQALCDASTSQSIRARISYLEFENIKPKTILFFDGVRYVWTESNWSKGIATFKVSKISA